MRFAHLKRILKLGGSDYVVREVPRTSLCHRQNLRRFASLVRATTTRAGSVHRVASKLRKMRQGQRFRAQLSTKGPTGKIPCSRLLQQNRPTAEIVPSRSTKAKAIGGDRRPCDERAQLGCRPPATTA